MHDLIITCTPAQHFSGRGLFDRNATLWASWAIENESQLGEGKISMLHEYDKHNLLPKKLKNKYSQYL